MQGYIHGNYSITVERPVTLKHWLQINQQDDGTNIRITETYPFCFVFTVRGSVEVGVGWRQAMSSQTDNTKLNEIYKYT